MKSIMSRKEKWELKLGIIRHLKPKNMYSRNEINKILKDIFDSGISPPQYYNGQSNMSLEVVKRSLKDMEGLVDLHIQSLMIRKKQIDNLINDLT